MRLLRCDRGSNFIGAKGELEAALAELDNPRNQRELLKDHCDWIEFCMNVPHASHMGGVWERMIRTVRSVLNGLLTQHASQLDDELLHTLMVEVESIVNSRPLTLPDMSSCDSLEPLTPSQLLTLKSKVVQPLQGKFVKQDLFCRKRWRRVQFLANEFWMRWHREFLPTLQERRKWCKDEPDFRVQDVVSLMDENAARADWPMGVITQVYPSKDGRVRKIQVRVGRSYFDCPIQKLVLLYRS